MGFQDLFGGRCGDLGFGGHAENPCASSGSRVLVAMDMSCGCRANEAASLGEMPECLPNAELISDCN